MERETGRRRINMIASHFAPAEVISPTHILPMNCSSSLNFVMPRCDNRMYFARQASASQAFFMKQVSAEQGSLEKPAMSSNYSAPLFSRPTRMEPDLSNVDTIRPPVESCNSLPSFARPSSSICKKKHSHSSNKMRSPSQSNGYEWSPMMDVAESESSYIVTVEIPGVNASDIRVEVNDHNLTITGKRSMERLKGNDSISAYHRKQIPQGPYRVVWPLPSHVYKDAVCAEFLDGILQIIIPKVGG